jgi:hypothetical protein
MSSLVLCVSACVQVWRSPQRLHRTSLTFTDRGRAKAIIHSSTFLLSPYPAPYPARGSLHTIDACHHCASRNGSCAQCPDHCVYLVIHFQFASSIVRGHLTCLDSYVWLPYLSSCCKSSGSIRRSLQLSLAWTSAFQISSILAALNYIRLGLNLSTHWQFIWGNRLHTF